MPGIDRRALGALVPTAAAGREGNGRQRNRQQIRANIMWGPPLKCVTGRSGTLPDDSHKWRCWRPGRGDRCHPHRHAHPAPAMPSRRCHCAAGTGITLRRDIRTRPSSANAGSALTAASGPAGEPLARLDVHDRELRVVALGIGIGIGHDARQTDQRLLVARVIDQRVVTLSMLRMCFRASALVTPSQTARRSRRAARTGTCRRRSSGSSRLGVGNRATILDLESPCCPPGRRPR